MRMKFIAVGKDEYTDPNTGEIKHAYTLSLMDAEGLKTVRVPVGMYRELQGLPQLSDVEVEFGFEKGRFAHFAAVKGVRVVSGAKTA